MNGAQNRLDDQNTIGRTTEQTIKTTLGLLPLLALSTVLAEPAFAQSVEIPIDEINVEGGQGQGKKSYKKDRVSSKKATAPLVNTPQTVTVIPERVIEEQGATDLIDVLKNVPGISFDAGENGFSAGGNEIFIRGMKAVGSIFVDGSRDNGSRTRDTFNVQEVEVVKGIASTNGRGGGSGYINMVTKTPTLENFINASTRIGFDDDGRTVARGAVDVNRVVDDFAVRFNAMAEGGDVFGRDLADTDSWGVAPSLSYGLGTDFRAIFAYEHFESGGQPDSGVVINRSYGTPIDGYFGNPPRGPQGSAPRDAFFNNAGVFTPPTKGYDDTISDAFLARFEYDATDWLTISNQTRWSKLDRDASYYFAGSASLNNLDRENDTLTNQTNLLAEFDTGSVGHTLSAGIDLSRENADTIRFDGSARPKGTVEVDTAAVYLYDTIELTEQWLVNGGIRAEHYSVDLTDSGNGIPGSGSAFSDSQTTVGGQFGVIYKPRPEGSIYASYGLSHLPHGSLLSNPDPSRNNNAYPGFVAGAKPVAAHNYEAGVKWDFFDGNLSVTGALFRTEKHNVPVASVSGSELYGYQKQIVQGVEVGVAGTVTPGWNIFGAATLLDSERKISKELDILNCESGNQGDVGLSNGGQCTSVSYESWSRNGDELAFTPKVTANLWTTYDLTEKWTLGGGVQYVGGSWIGRPDDASRMIKNGIYGKVPSYFLVNLMASYAYNENVTFRVNVDNLFDETYLTTANWNGSWGYLGAPRTYRFGTSFSF